MLHTNSKHIKNIQKTYLHQQQQQHTSTWLVIMLTLWHVIIVTFWLYFKAQKLHETPCIYTTWQMYLQHILIINTKDNSSRFIYEQRAELIECISVSVAITDARNLYRIVYPPSVWPHLFCGADREKRRGEQLKWSYIGSFPCAQLPGPVRTAWLGQLCFYI